MMLSAALVGGIPYIIFLVSSVHSNFPFKVLEPGFQLENYIFTERFNVSDSAEWQLKSEEEAETALLKIKPEQKST